MEKGRGAIGTGKEKLASSSRCYARQRAYGAARGSEVAMAGPGGELRFD